MGGCRIGTAASEHTVRTDTATAPLTLVGSSADAPAPLLRPSPATGYEAEILDVYDPSLGYDTEHILSKQPSRTMRSLSRAGLLGELSRETSRPGPIAMKRMLLTSLLVVSVLGNLVTIGVGGYMYLQLRPLIQSTTESAATEGEVLDVISIDEDGYKNRYLIVRYKGQRVVVQDYPYLTQDRAPVTVGQSIQIKAIKGASSPFPLVHYVQAQ
jgi:hypothetical protein